MLVVFMLPPLAKNMSAQLYNMAATYIAETTQGVEASASLGSAGAISSFLLLLARPVTMLLSGCAGMIQ